MLRLRRKLFPPPPKQKVFAWDQVHGPSGAYLSADGRHRYMLWRRWGPGHLMVIVMLNPSTADAMENDPTVTRCIGFARTHNYDGILIVNLHSYRSTDPAGLRGQTADPENTQVVTEALVYANITSNCVLCAWGAEVRKHPGIRDTVREVSRRLGVSTTALKVLADGTPGHPLYLAAGLLAQKLEI